MTRLERELDTAESTRQREVSACARSAAEQVQQLSGAIMKADRMLAEVTLENERLNHELAAILGQRAKLRPVLRARLRCRSFMVGEQQHAASIAIEQHASRMGAARSTDITGKRGLEPHKSKRGSRDRVSTGCEP